jgi:uncharacterized protein (DUF488 family)
MTASLSVYTIGHSTRPLDELIALLRAHGITRLVDVRTVPRSRRHPHVNREALPAPLAAAGISYEHMASLGGLRHPRRDSLNTGWRNAGFRGFADYMQTPEFEQGLEALLVRARREAIALMCAEALPWRCHRSLIADALIVRGVEVRHIMSATRANRHTLTAFAVVDGTRLTYPVDPAQPDLPAAGA